MIGTPHASQIPHLLLPPRPRALSLSLSLSSLQDEFPNVAIDTLAYQWSRPAPKITKPRDNVIIRLCSIECNFGAPLTDPSNAPFQTDIVNWGILFFFFFGLGLNLTIPCLDLSTIPPPRPPHRRRVT